MTWTDGVIPDCTIRPFRVFTDSRGWLAEIFRKDDLEDAQFPAMGYISVTHAGVTRGPHEHAAQTDLFAFYSGTFDLYLWDDRETSDSYGTKMHLSVGENDPIVILIPPGIVHAYRNSGTVDAVVLNLPNRLYAGRDKQEPVDEIRHEDRNDGRFLLE